MKPSRTFPDHTTPPSADPSSADASSADTSSTDPSAGARDPFAGFLRRPDAADPSSAGGTDGSSLQADDAPVLEGETVAPDNHATAAGEESVAPAMPPRSVMTVFKELAKCPDLNALTAHVQANPEILDFLQSRRGMLPVFSDKPPPTFPAPGQLRSYDDYVDVLFTKQADGTWRNVNYSR
ncbi:MAG: hypothetical protein EPN91_07015 [Salinibacterium sp.]|nr:MAG: hypothetical protein EPN91_07015 [Salinibacterium sp.]